MLQQPSAAGAAARLGGQAAQPVSTRRSVLVIYQRGVQIWSQAATALVSFPVCGTPGIVRLV